MFFHHSEVVSMSFLKNKLQKIQKSHLQLCGVLLLIALAVCLLWFGNITSTQAVPALVAQVYFDGEYSIDGGEWHPIVDGEHIPATRGDVTLRGNFHMLAPDGEYVGIYRGEIPIAFYTNHISLTFYEGEGEPYVMDSENPIYGKSACSATWNAHTFMSDENEIIEILVNNPHSFGNETAIDEMLSGIALWTGIDFEKDALKSGETERTAGILFMLVSLVFLGTALFSTLIHIKKSSIIWLLGLVVLFAGLYFAYSADGVMFWNESVVSNTTLLGLSMMFYMLFLLISITHFLKTTKKISNITVICLAVANAVFFALPILTDVLFYDTWLWWTLLQILANTVIAVCIIKEFFCTKTKERWFYLGALMPLISFGVDAAGILVGV